jgi:hypothetical protein
VPWCAVVLKVEEVGPGDGQRLLSSGRCPAVLERADGAGAGFRVSSTLWLSLKMSNGNSQPGQGRSNGRKRGNLRPYLIYPLHGLSIVKMFGSGGDTFLMVGAVAMMRFSYSCC